MRVFHNSGIYGAYLPRLRRLAPASESFSVQMRAFLDDRYGACHILAPIYDGSPDMFYVNGDDKGPQEAWAREKGLPTSASVEDIVLAQIEEHGSEIFYNQHPMRFGNEFLRRLPGCVRRTIAWRAAPSAGGDFDKHDLVVCNFPGILDHYRRSGMRAEYFFPSHDPVMNEFCEESNRETDILFVGGYSRHHGRRSEMLKRVAALGGRFKVKMHLNKSRLVQVAETPLGWLPPLDRWRLPPEIKAVASGPVFGRELYKQLSSAKIVLNGAIDMAGLDRGNMRCWEALGCGALMVSDEGRYPQGMDAGSMFVTYADERDVTRVITELLSDPERVQNISRSGHEMIQSEYSKAKQWRAFERLVEALC